MFYFAFEVVTDSNYEMWVDTDEGQFKTRLLETVEPLEHIEEVLLGTVIADDIPSALEKIRRSDWESLTLTRDDALLWLKDWKRGDIVLWGKTYTPTEDKHLNADYVSLNGKYYAPKDTT